MNEEKLSNWFSSAKEVSARLAETLEMLEDVTRLTSDWVWSLDRDFRISFISDQIFNSCGVAPEEVLGLHLTDFGRFIGDPPQFQKPFRDAPFEVVSQSKGRRDLLVSGLPVFSMETGQFNGVRGIVRDITEKTEAERISARLGSAIEEMSEIFMLSDQEDNLVVMNKPARQANTAIMKKFQLGESFEQFITAVAHSGTISDALGNEEDWIADRMEKHKYPDRPFEQRRENGTHFLIHEEKLPDGSTATFCVDISDRKQMERALQESLKRQQEFSADVAHELRTPLAVLRANLDSPKGELDIDSLKGDVDRVSRIVEELLAESRMQGLEIATDERADILGIAKSVATYAGPSAIRKKRMIEVTGTDKPALVWGRTEAIEQAVRNLVENAIDHSSEGTTVTIKVTESPAIYIIDRGVGIPDDAKASIFRRQLRADRRQSGRQGLGVVRRIADAHGATIGVDDAPEGGAVFFIRFPNLEENGHIDE